MARNNQRNSKNNNPEGKNQYSYGYADIARERPLATALGTAAAVGAGVFLWSRRNQISEQLSNLSEQIGEWTSGSQSGEFETTDGPSDFGSAASTGMSETGGGNASLGAHSGGGGTTSAGNSGRAKA